MATTSAPSPTTPTGRRPELLEAALHVVAGEGLKGLTHRAVDRRAGLSEGTCSAYFRTRDSLLTGLTQYVAASLGADVRALSEDLQDCSATADPQGRAVELVVDRFEQWLDQREMLLTRLELSMEALRNPALAELLSGNRARLTAIVETTMAAQGKGHRPRSAEVMLAAFDGLLLAALQKPSPQRHTFLAAALAQILEAFSAPST